MKLLSEERPFLKNSCYSESSTSSFSFECLIPSPAKAGNPEQYVFAEEVADDERNGADEEIFDVDIEPWQRRERPGDGEQDFHVEVVDGVRCL